MPLFTGVFLSMIGFCPLASGSRGNALYVGTENTKLLIDAGISLKDLTRRLQQISVSMEEIDAVLITHEHIDHVRGLAVLCKKWNIPVLANKETAKAIGGMLTPLPRFKIFTTGETFFFQDLEIHPFSIQHDAIDPVAFTLKTKDYKIGVCADLGFVSSLVEHHLQLCDYLYLEANHEPSMVHSCSRPMIYKQRVLGRLGHLSNEESANLIAKVHTPKLKKVYLGHLSSECNCPKLAVKIVKETLAREGKEVDVTVAPQGEISSPVYFLFSLLGETKQIAL